MLLSVVATSDAAVAATPEPQVVDRLRVGTRLHGRLIATDNEAVSGNDELVQEAAYRADLRRVRLIIDFEPRAWLKAQIDVDFGSIEPGLRDAYVSARAAPWLSIRVGRFKKPFSRVELIGADRLPLWRRGIANTRIVEELNYGGRQLGAQASGRIDWLHYAVGVFDSGLRTRWPGLDTAARLTAKPSDQIQLGLSASMQYRTTIGEEPERPRARRDSWAAGVDGRLRLGAVELISEILWAVDGARRYGVHRLGALLYVEARLPLTNDLQLAPLFKVELFDDNLRRAGDLTPVWTAGANLHIGDNIRLMAQGELVRPQKNALGMASIYSIRSGKQIGIRERRFVLQLAFDDRMSIVQILEED